MLEQYLEEILLLGCGLLLCTIYNLVDAWFLKKYGSNRSTIRGNLIDGGYDSTYGPIMALMYPVSVLVCYLGYLAINPADSISIRALALLTLLLYTILAVALNFWGKNYLKSRNLDPTPPSGYKGFWQTFKDYYKEMREQQKRKD